MDAISQAATAKQLHLPKLISRPNVVGVGVGLRQRNGRVQDEVCVVALVRRKRPRTALAPEAVVPAELDGVPVDVLEVGELRAQAVRTARLRPAPGGCSIGHFQITAGTLGCIVRDRSSGARLILSNNHVLANGNEAQPEDPILQPGAADGGREENDTLALLERFVPIAYSRVDAAVARPLIDADVSDDVLEIGRVSGTVAASLGLAIRKSGRTTGLTTGQITIIETTVDIDYGGKTARFDGQLTSGPMSQPGDSGSLLVAGASQQAVGLLFAGSTQATIYNPIADVLQALHVELP
jgi:hypothetical protein